MTEDEYEFLMDKWTAVKGAAYNAVYEFCREAGWCDINGLATPAGFKAVQEYEMEKWNL